jgi:hypothetical protein
MHRLTVCLLLAIALVSVASLVTGASYLGIVLPGGLPLGNAIAASGLVSTAAAAVLLSASDSRLRAAALCALCAAIAWLPLSIVLAGNPALNFAGWRGTVWMGSSLLVLLAVLLVLAWAIVQRLRR